MLDMLSRLGKWQCHRYTDGQNNAWCESKPVVDGWEYALTKGDGTCGHCWCCKAQTPSLESQGPWKTDLAELHQMYKVGTEAAKAIPPPPVPTPSKPAPTE